MLPQIRDALVSQAGDLDHSAEMRAMFESGQLSATKYTLKRVGYSEATAVSLLNALKEVPQLSLNPPIVDVDGGVDSKA